MISEKVSSDRSQLLTNLYLKGFPQTCRYVAKRGGTLEEAKDIFQEALVIFYENHIAPGSAHANNTGYLLGIARNLWNKRYHELERNEMLDSGDLADLHTEPPPSASRVLNFIRTAGEKCLNMLKAVYYHGQSMEELAENFGFSSIRSATVQKYKCLEKVRNKVKQQSLHYEDFLEEN